MAKNFHVSIVTPDKMAYDGEAVSLVVPAEFGYLGVLADHAPLAASLKRGTITLQDPSGSTKIFGSSDKGFLEVARNVVTLLLDSVDI